MTYLLVVYDLRVTIGNDTIQANLMEIGRFELQHLVDTLLVNFVRSITDFFASSISASEPSLDQFLAIFVQKIKGGKVGTRGDLDQLGETVSDLRRR